MMLKSTVWLDKVAAFEKAQGVLESNQETKEDKVHAASAILGLAPTLFPKKQDFVLKAIKAIYHSDELHDDLHWRAFRFMTERDIKVPPRKAQEPHRRPRAFQTDFPPMNLGIG